MTDDLIRSTYRASINLFEFETFEKSWEQFLDQCYQESGPGVELENMQQHFDIAMTMLERLNVQVELNHFAQKLADSQVGPCLILSAQGKIWASNNDAQKCFVEENTHHLHETGFQESEKNQILEWIARQADNIDHDCLFLRLTVENEMKTCFLTSVDYEEDQEKRRVFLLSCVEEPVSKSLEHVIQQTFGLTTAEAEVAVMLSNGMAPKEISELRGRSLYTVRSQIRDILQKTDCGTAQDLSRLLMSMSSKYVSVEKHTERLRVRKPSAPYIRKHSVLTTSGRVIDVTDQGDGSGIPVLKVHAVLTNTVLAKSVVAMAERAGVRIIASSRAGFGGSDPINVDGMSAYIDACCDDYARVLDHLKIDKVILQCDRSGAFAQRFALKYPERTVGIVMAGGVPLWQTSYLDSMKPRHRMVVKTALRAPFALPYLTSLGFAFIKAGKVATFLRQVDESEDVDLKALENREMRETTKRMFEHVASQGTQAFVTELPIVYSDFSDDAKKLTCPVTVLVAGSRREQPKQAFKRYEELVPHAIIRRLEDAGMYIVGTHYNKIIEAVLEMASGSQSLQKIAAE